jgi:hypothetical protein
MNLIRKRFGLDRPACSSWSYVSRPCLKAIATACARESASSFAWTALSVRRSNLRAVG